MEQKNNLHLDPQHERHAFADDNKVVLPQQAVPTQRGVANVEAASAVWSPLAKAFLFFGVACIAYIYSLDGTTTYQYQAFATSSFSLHSALSTIAVVQAITLAIAKPVSAKISDVFGRAQAFILAVVLYVVGFIIVASSKGIESYGAGAVIYYMGYASIQILIQIVIADLTTLRWRTLVSSCTSLPFFINAFVSSNIAQGVLPDWRWGYGMFAIIIPAGAAPIILTLIWAQFKAKRLGVLATVYHGEAVAVNTREKRPMGKALWANISEIDLVGLLLIALSVALILVPLTITNSALNSWRSASVIAMIVIGFCLLFAVVAWEGWFAKFPVVPGRFLRNPTVLAACIINMFDFISFYLQFTYQYSFMYITHPTWSIKEQGYFGYTQTLSLTLFAVLAGFYVLQFRRLKWLLVAGLAVRLLGVGLMIHSKGANGSTGELVIVQIIQGAGGGIAAATTQTAAQAVVPHQDVAIVTAVVLLFAEIGGAIGTAIAGAIWRNTMPGQLSRHLAGLADEATITSIYGSITTAATYPAGSPIHTGVVQAYTQVMVWLLIPATVLAVIPFAASFFIKNIELNAVRNIVEEEDAVSITESETKDVKGHLA